MRLGDLPAWSVPGQSPASDAEGPLGRSVHTEQPMCERPVLGQSWRQALQVKAKQSRRATFRWCAVHEGSTEPTDLVREPVAGD